MGERVKPRVLATALFGVATVAVSGTVIAFSGTTFSSYSDDESSTPSSAGAAVVALGRDGPTPDLGYADLRPGVPQTVDLTVSYDGSVPAAVGLSFAPQGASVLCGRSGGSWSARPGRAATVTVGTGPAHSYCSLLGGEVLPLGPAAPGGADLVVPVTITLAEGAAPDSAGLQDVDAVVVHADGGFTDRVAGRITMSTAAADSLPPPPVGTPAFVEAALVLPGDAPALVLDGTDPAATARTASAGGGIALPTECLDAGIRPEDIAEVIALDPVSPSWDATARRGEGAGPFLVLGTAVADTVTGSSQGDCVVGGGGADVIGAGDGDDVVVGGAGDDRLGGDAGSDRLRGGAGRDDLRGGAGRDLMDGGPDGATCDTTTAEDSVRCLAPTPAPAPPPAAVAPPPPAAPAPGPVAPAAPAPEPPSADPAPPAAPETPVEEPAPSGRPAADEPATGTTGAGGTTEPGPNPQPADS